VVNASLNWASIVGIVLAVGGAFLYFMRSFKPALARDYDVFFAAIGLLCGGILFFQGWRLDPILQFGQFLLAGTTVFFAYESVRLRGVTTEQARRSSFFDDDEPLPPPARGRMGGGDWNPDVDRLEEPQPLRRRIRSREAEPEDDDFYRPRRTARPAIPERAASRRPADTDDWDPAPRSPRVDDRPAAVDPGFRAGSSPRSTAAPSSGPAFGARRRDRDVAAEPRRGTRPTASSESVPRSSRRTGNAPVPGAGPLPGGAEPSSRPAAGVPMGSPLRGGLGGAPASGSTPDPASDADYTPLRSSSSASARNASGPAGARNASSSARPGSSRDNSSRFDD
jgi:hypothetical protein